MTVALPRLFPDGEASAAVYVPADTYVWVACPENVEQPPLGPGSHAGIFIEPLVPSPKFTAYEPIEVSPDAAKVTVSGAWPDVGLTENDA